MAKAIYVTSTKRFSGKTALCIGLIHWLEKKGFKGGYMKPISTTARAVGDKIVDEDAAFIRSTFNQSDALDAMVPFMLSDQETRSLLEAPNMNDVEARIIEAYQSLAKDKDVVIMEGGTNLREGWMVNLPPFRLSSLLGAGVLVVVPYIDTLQVVDDLLAAKTWFGDSLIGGVVNIVPTYQLDPIEEKVKPFLEKRGVQIFGVLPRERVLLSVSVAELVNELGGEILCCPEASGELVENLMVGAMGVESALTHFRRGANKAVITGGDRPDVQIAALETSTRCLILTGNLRPNPLIIGIAEERGVPIVLTRHDTLKAIEIVDSFFDKTRFHQRKKVAHFERLCENRMDLPALSMALKLPTE